MEYAGIHVGDSSTKWRISPVCGWCARTENGLLSRYPYAPLWRRGDLGPENEPDTSTRPGIVSRQKKKKILCSAFTSTTSQVDTFKSRCASYFCVSVTLNVTRY